MVIRPFIMKKFLILGDFLTILLFTLVGFATHGEANISFLPRMAAIFFPLSISWFILAPSLQLFNQHNTSDPRQLWRPILGMIFASSLAAVMRGLILNAPIIPIFAIVLSAVSAVGILLWRIVWYWIVTHR